LLIALE